MCLLNPQKEEIVLEALESAELMGEHAALKHTASLKAVVGKWL